MPPKKKYKVSEKEKARKKAARDDQKKRLQEIKDRRPEIFKNAIGLGHVGTAEDQCPAGKSWRTGYTRANGVEVRPTCVKKRARKEDPRENPLSMEYDPNFDITQDPNYDPHDPQYNPLMTVKNLRLMLKFYGVPNSHLKVKKDLVLAWIELATKEDLPPISEIDVSLAERIPDGWAAVKAREAELGFQTIKKPKPTGNPAIDDPNWRTSGKKITRLQLLAAKKHFAARGQSDVFAKHKSKPLPTPPVPPAPKRPVASVYPDSEEVPLVLNKKKKKKLTGNPAIDYPSGYDDNGVMIAVTPLQLAAAQQQKAFLESIRQGKNLKKTLK